MSISQPIAIHLHDAMRPIFQVDKERNLHQIILCIIHAIKNHGLSFQLIEKQLRAQHCFTYLIARERKKNFSEEYVQFLLPYESLTKTYYLFTSTRDREKAMQELLEESTSYEENFKKLEDTGFVILNENANLSDQITTGFVEIKDPFTPWGRFIFNPRIFKMLPFLFFKLVDIITKVHFLLFNSIFPH